MQRQLKVFVVLSCLVLCVIEVRFMALVYLFYYEVCLAVFYGNPMARVENCQSNVFSIGKYCGVSLLSRLVVGMFHVEQWAVV